MKAWVNESCIYCGLCVDLCPEIFQFGDERAKVTVDEIPLQLESRCREAAEECPANAIKIKE